MYQQSPTNSRDLLLAHSTTINTSALAQLVIEDIFITIHAIDGAEWAEKLQERFRTGTIGARNSSAMVANESTGLLA